jgi:DNA-binding winged helix-turn-helix (wHTH) protein
MTVAMRYSFGDCWLDTASREFSRRGQSVHLSPKAFDLLCTLIQQRPRVVGKAELMQALWPDTFVVEGNLPVIVAEVRDALGDRAFGARAIKTHHGIGYGFTLDVEESSQSRRVDPNDPQLLLIIGSRHLSLSAGVNEVGREATCDVYINDASVSRSHARIDVRGEAATITDLGSKNGTRVRGAVLAAPADLQDGDEITFGSVKARFIIKTRRDPRSTVTL